MLLKRETDQLDHNVRIRRDRSAIRRLLELIAKIDEVRRVQARGQYVTGPSADSLPAFDWQSSGDVKRQESPTRQLAPAVVEPPLARRVLAHDLRGQFR